MMKLEDLKKYEYYEGIGRRKESVARVRVYKLGKDGEFFIMINGQPVEKFFDEFKKAELVGIFNMAELKGNWGISIQAKGGGMTGWKDAIKLGLARALVKINPDLRPVFRKAGLLTRDARVVERKKVGLKKARKAPRWSKR